MVRLATVADLPALQQVYAAARAFMRQAGNPNQWGNTYPPNGLLQSDLEQNRLYVIEREGTVCGGFCFFLGEEPDYAVIENGEWPGPDLPYGVIHRVASNGKERGILAECVAYCRQHCNRIRIDTHRQNLPMQRSLERQGFRCCGIVHLNGLTDGEERLAYAGVWDSCLPK